MKAIIAPAPEKENKKENPSTYSDVRYLSSSIPYVTEKIIFDTHIRNIKKKTAPTQTNRSAVDETKITGENKQRIMVQRRQVKKVNKKKSTAAKEPLSRKSKGPKQQSNFQIEHQRQVEIEMERIKETYPVLFPEKEPSEQNHHKTKANGGKRYNSLVNNNDDLTDSVLDPNHKDSSTTMDTEDNQDGGGQPRRKVIKSSDESSIEMELDGDSVNNCEAESVKITNVVDLVSDKEDNPSQISDGNHKQETNRTEISRLRSYKPDK